MNKTNNEALRGNAQRLRREMTKEERRLWFDCFKQMEETVKRQHVMGQYIVDFYCAAAKLVIELDGSQHYEEEGKQKDRKRDQYLEGLGLLVKRYSNSDINQRFSAVCEDIYETIQERKEILNHKRTPKPSP
ncbi:MAG: endonuclease domain-containing protein [Candidatus Avoscillospira sp.]